ncbi:MAG: type I-C CRISPR-associated protein Cas8c/Csd1 [Nitrospirae bacterium]|nr:type I-C CRISPR-associated protein Cas8c/Csd1 [Nitrospirota bacterium]
MILQALYDLFDRRKDELPEEGFEDKEIPFLIGINSKGEFVSLQDTRTLDGKKLNGRKFRVPKGAGRSSPKAWQMANLLWDHYGYVFGYSNSDSDNDKEKTEKQHETFVKQIQKLAATYPSDIELNAVMEFYKNKQHEDVFKHPLWLDCKNIAGCNLTFQIDGVGHICDNDNVRAYVSSKINQLESDRDEDDVPLQKKEGICLITGNLSTIARLHPRTPIAGAKSNAKIVSFQKKSGFDSYGKEQSYNAPVSEKAAFAYTTALNYLLAKGSPQKIYVGDTTTVFWADKKHKVEDLFIEIFGEPAKGEPEQDYKSLISMFRSPETGVKVELDPETKFYVLGLAPNAARIAIRFWYAGTVGEIVDKMWQHFDDLEIVKSPNEWRTISLRNLLRSTAQQEKDKNISPNLAGDFMKAILAGTPYPVTLLSSVIRRIKAEQSKKDSNGKPMQNVTYPRAALIKAVLVRQSRYRNEKEEIGMSLNLSNMNIGYRLGRLFSVLEKIQEEANPGINATIRDRFYGSASSTPVTVFPFLMRLKNHHLAKLENKGRVKNMEKLIAEIMDSITEFPGHLSLDDQGRFTIGYYHQRRDLYTKKDKTEEDPTND